jgi:transcription initiation factor IIE alpha subunit
MYLCETDKHDEIVHTTRDCPLCDAVKEIEDLSDQSNELETEIQELKNEIT